jgi:hypothetical protein
MFWDLEDSDLEYEAMSSGEPATRHIPETLLWEPHTSNLEIFTVRKIT